MLEELTDDEKKLYCNLDIENFFREVIIKTIKKKSAIHTKELNKYKLIEEMIRRLETKKCPQCGNRLSKDDDFDYNETFIGLFSCNLGHKYGLHEIYISYLWKIMDIVNEKIENIS